MKLRKIYTNTVVVVVVLFFIIYSSFIGIACMQFTKLWSWRCVRIYRFCHLFLSCERKDAWESLNIILLFLCASDSVHLLLPISFRPSRLITCFGIRISAQVTWTNIISYERLFDVRKLSIACRNCEISRDLLLGVYLYLDFLVCCCHSIYSDKAIFILIRM